MKKAGKTLKNIILIYGIDEMKTKVCTKCNKIKSLSEFNKNKLGKDKRHSQCKSCLSIYCKKYYHKNKDRIKNNTKKYQEINKIKLNKKAQIYRENNKKKFKEYIKIYRIKNKCIIKKQVLKYTQKRKKNDKGFHILLNQRTRLHHALKGLTKSNRTIILLGCEIDYLLYHLQKQFKKNMSWDNYGYGKGKWVIDHIQPCCSFDLSKESEQRKCFHYTNLQPLWWEKNKIKRSQDVRKRKKK